MKVDPRFESIKPIIINSDSSNKDVALGLPNWQTVGTTLLRHPPYLLVWLPLLRD